MITQRTTSPPIGYTNNQWQLDFINLKSKIKQCKTTLMPNVKEISEVSSQEYGDKTQYQRYSDFINGILKSIRNGHVDYCFYIYQIAELLRYEHDNLKATWLEPERCFRVFLEN